MSAKRINLRKKVKKPWLRIFFLFFSLFLLCCWSAVSLLAGNFLFGSLNFCEMQRFCCCFPLQHKKKTKHKQPKVISLISFLLHVFHIVCLLLPFEFSWKPICQQCLGAAKWQKIKQGQTAADNNRKKRQQHWHAAFVGCKTTAWAIWRWFKFTWSEVVSCLGIRKINCFWSHPW